MSRPRTRTDEALLDGALLVMREIGPDRLTFAAVAAATGLAAPTLVQRFGSKPALVRAALVRAWDLLDARTATCDAAAPATQAGAISLLVALSAAYADEDDYAQGLLLLREDLRDPVLRERGRRWGGMLAEALGRRLADWTGPRPDLGRLMAAQWQGAVLWWCFSREGSLADAISDALGAWCRAIDAGRPRSG